MGPVKHLAPWSLVIVLVQPICDLTVIPPLLTEIVDGERIGTVGIRYRVRPRDGWHGQIGGRLGRFQCFEGFSYYLTKLLHGCKCFWFDGKSGHFLPVSSEKQRIKTSFNTFCPQMERL